MAKPHRNLRVVEAPGLEILVEGTPVLQKPFSPLALARKVRDVLEAPPTPSGV